MKDPKTIKEAIEQIQEAISLVIPGMQVTVSINLTSASASASVDNVIPHEEVKKASDTLTVPDAIDESATTDVDLKGLRALLNAYAKTAGKEKALELVSKFSKTGNPNDIPTERYKDVIKAMGGDTLEPQRVDA